MIHGEISIGVGGGAVGDWDWNGAFVGCLIEGNGLEFNARRGFCAEEVSALNLTPIKEVNVRVFLEGVLIDLGISGVGDDLKQEWAGLPEEVKGAVGIGLGARGLGIVDIQGAVADLNA